MRENMFKKWTIDRYKALSPNGEYQLWIANGFTFFKDYCSFRKGDKQFLHGLTYFEKRKVWKELQKEIRRRAFEIEGLSELLNKDK